MSASERERRRRIEATFGAHYGAVAAYFGRRCGSPQDAEDATAQVFAVAWTRLERLPPEPETRLWLYGVARRVLADQQRAGRRRERLGARLSASAPAAFADPIADVQEAFAVREAWNGMSDGDRELLALVAWEGLAVSEVSRVLRLPAPLVSARLSRARRRLARRLELVSTPTAPPMTRIEEPHHA